MRHATGAMAVLAMCGPRAEEMAQKLAKGLLAEWKQASLAQKRGIWNAARTMPMGHERQACLKFMRMVEEGERQGDDMTTWWALGAWAVVAAGAFVAAEWGEVSEVWREWVDDARKADSERVRKGERF